MSAPGARGRGSVPLVSVLAASREAADSAGAQEYPQLELVRLQDSSGDPIAALGAGLGEARGELAIYLAPGDTLLPDAVSKLAAALVARPGVAFVYPAFRLLDEKGEETATTVPEELDFTEMLMFQHSPVGAGAIFRRDLALEALPASAESVPFGDLVFWLGLAARGEARRLIEPLACRRAGADERTASDLASARERLAVLDRILAEPGLPVASEAALRTAARSACVLAAMEFGQGFNAPQERFHIADRFADHDPGEAVLDDDARIALLEARIVNTEQRLARHRAVIPVLESIVIARENRLAAGAEGSGRSLRSVARRLLRSGDDG